MDRKLTFFIQNDIKKHVFIRGLYRSPDYDSNELTKFNKDEAQHHAPIILKMSIDQHRSSLGMISWNKCRKKFHKEFRKRKKYLQIHKKLKLCLY
jgi:hypothetical protein